MVMVVAQFTKNARRFFLCNKYKGASLRRREETCTYFDAFDVRHSPRWVRSAGRPRAEAAYYVEIGSCWFIG